MRSNLFEGFGSWLQTIGVDPKYGAEQPIVLANVILRTADGGRTIKYPRLSMFKVLAFDPKERWAKIQDVNYPDQDNRNLASFPHGISPSDHAGQVFILQGKEFDKLIAPQVGAMPPQMGSMGIPGAPTSTPGMPNTPFGTPAMPAAAGPTTGGFTGEF